MRVVHGSLALPTPGLQKRPVCPPMEHRRHLDSAAFHAVWPSHKHFVVFRGLVLNGRLIIAALHHLRFLPTSFVSHLRANLSWPLCAMRFSPQPPYIRPLSFCLISSYSIWTKLLQVKDFLVLLVGAPLLFSPVFVLLFPSLPLPPPFFKNLYCPAYCNDCIVVAFVLCRLVVDKVLTPACSRCLSSVAQQSRYTRL